VAEPSAGPIWTNNGNNRRYGLSDQPNRFVASHVRISVRRRKTLRAEQSIQPRRNPGRVEHRHGDYGQQRLSVVVSGANTGAIRDAVNRVSASLNSASDLQHWYDEDNGHDALRLKMTRRRIHSQYNACAFQGQVVTTPNGSWCLNHSGSVRANQSSAIFVDGSFQHRSESQETFSIHERLSYRFPPMRPTCSPYGVQRTSRAVWANMSYPVRQPATAPVRRWDLAWNVVIARPDHSTWG